MEKENLDLALTAYGLACAILGWATIEILIYLIKLIF